MPDMLKRFLTRAQRKSPSLQTLERQALDALKAHRVAERAYQECDVFDADGCLVLLDQANIRLDDSVDRLLEMEGK